MQTLLSSRMACCGDRLWTMQSWQNDNPMAKTTATTLEVVINLPLMPYLFGFIGWTLMWQFQVVLTKNIPALEFALGVSLIFLPAGIRTLSVLLFGFKGAVGVFFGTTLSTLQYMGHVATMDFWVHNMISAISAFSAWLAMVLVCRTRGFLQSAEQLFFAAQIFVVMAFD